MNTKETPHALAQRCRARASRVGFPPMREALLSIAEHYELDADLLESSLQTIIDSERLMAKADELLRQLNAGQGALGRPELGSSFPPLAAERHFDQWVFRHVRVGSPMMNPIGEIKPPLAQSRKSPAIYRRGRSFGGL